MKKSGQEPSPTYSFELMSPCEHATGAVALTFLGTHPNPRHLTLVSALSCIAKVFPPYFDFAWFYGSSASTNFAAHVCAAVQYG
eukprot:6172782-Pleurochrysis_carterae.AAC.2